MPLTCLSCGGTYEPVLADGMLYFHRCPPLSVAELQAALDAGTIQLAAADADRLQAAHAADAADPLPADAIPRAAVVLASIRIERPNARDENVHGGPDPERAQLIKAAGAGVRTVR